MNGKLMLKSISFNVNPPTLKILKPLSTMTFICYILLLSCAHDAAHIKSLSNDITTQGFINNNCYQCIITAKTDPGIEGLVAGRESSHINLLKSLDQQCYDNLITVTAQLQGISVTDSSLQQCLLQQLKPYVEKKVIVVTYFNEDFSETAVVRIYEDGLKQKLTTLRCK